jgi:hypothetical protein
LAWLSVGGATAAQLSEARITLESEAASLAAPAPRLTSRLEQALRPRIAQGIAHVS